MNTNANTGNGGSGAGAGVPAGSGAGGGRDPVRIRRLPTGVPGLDEIPSGADAHGGGGGRSPRARGRPR
jgi:hypothetical protein